VGHDRDLPAADRSFRNDLLAIAQAWPLAIATEAAFLPHRASDGIRVALCSDMLKLLGSYALAKLLGFGLVGAIVIYALLSLLT